jgi:mono/diheme cytochrome c family protein
MGRRRTQSLAGGLLGTEPFHWSGDLGNFSDLMDEVFVNRMQAVPVSPAHVDAVALWLDGVAAPEADPAPDSDAAERGRALFAGRAACTSCHAGDSLTNDQTIDVGTGGAFQVPSLRGVFARAPYMHDGCADTLSDRLTDAVCGGDAHGRTADLDEGEITDLVAYVETL